MIFVVLFLTACTAVSVYAKEAGNKPLQIIAMALSLPPVVIVAFAVANALGSPARPEPPPQQLTETQRLAARLTQVQAASEIAVRDRLRDPDSAKFRNVRTHLANVRGDQIPVTCGEVSARNGLGGRNGYATYIAFGSALPPVFQDDMPTAEFLISVAQLCPGA